jgi:hypothetical protein
MPSIIAAGGARAATRPRRCGSMPSRQALGALTSIRMHDRRAAVVADLVLADRIEISLASTRRRQTLTPALAATVHGKHQPLQWNIGSVHR